MALNVLVIPRDLMVVNEWVKRGIDAVVPKLLTPEDRWEVGDRTRIDEPQGWDLILGWEPTGASHPARAIAQSGIPCMALAPTQVFHTYSAAFSREIEECGGKLLPAADPVQIAASIDAVRSAKVLSCTRLLVIDNHEDDARAEMIAEFGRCTRPRFGVDIVRRPVTDLVAVAAGIPQNAVDAEWSRWLAELLVGEGEMGVEHRLQVVRLFLATRQILLETRCSGVTIDDIGAFLLTPEKNVMPNAAYAPLVCDGYLACEEGDVEVLLAEAILRAGLNAHPTMSNIYMAYRDALDALGDREAYTQSMERSDYHQCIADNHLVAAHFSASGVLPRNMMVEDRYRIRETVPAWPGQSMTTSTPALGPVVMSRVSTDASRVHLVSGVVDQVSMDDRKGWYRGRWTIKIPNARIFTRHCLHQHYAIGPENGRSAVLDTMLRCVFKLGVTDNVNWPQPD